MKEPKSRQREWQISNVKEGKCALCAQSPLETKNHCHPCAESLRIQQRNKYRLRVGIPLDAPDMRRKAK